MCFLALHYKTVPEYPIVLAANRDEFYDRPGLPPADRGGGIIAGQDPRAGGTWLGVRRDGLIAAVTNLPAQTAHPHAHSRGLLCMKLLRSAGPADARNELQSAVDAHEMNPFNMLCVSPSAGWLASFHADRLTVRPLQPGLHVVGNALPDDPSDAKVRHGRELIGRPGPLDQTLASLAAVCADHGTPEGDRDAICVHSADFGTLSSTLLALHVDTPARHHLLFCDGPPCRHCYTDISHLLANAGG